MIEGESFLLTAAEIGVGFVAISAILILFRQVRGGEMSVYQLFVIQMFIEVGLMATLGALLPTLLAAAGVAPATTWRAGSAALGAAVLGYFVLYWYRRPKESELPATHPVVVVNVGGAYAASALLLVNAFAWGAAAPYLGAIGWLLVIMCTVLATFTRIYFLRP